MDNSLFEMFSKLFGGMSGQGSPPQNNQNISNNPANSYYPSEIRTASDNWQHSTGQDSFSNNFNKPNYPNSFMQNSQNNFNQNMGNFNQNTENFNQKLGNYNQNMENFSQNNSNENLGGVGQNQNFSGQNPLYNLFNNANQPQLLNMLLSMLGGKNLSGISDVMSNKKEENKNQASASSSPPKDDIIL